MLPFVISPSVAHLIQRSQENREKLKASYTAESMIRRIESQLSRYLENSEFSKTLFHPVMRSARMNLQIYRI